MLQDRDNYQKNKSVQLRKVAFALISACAVMIFFVHLYLNMNTMVKQEINQIQMSKIYVNGQDKVDTGRLTIKLSIITI